MRRLCLALICVPGVALGQDWVRQDDAGITAALSEQSFEYDSGATQTFYVSGRTFYEHGQPSWGTWEARDDRYCSQWPPASGWACYDLEIAGDRIRFIGDSGSITEGWVIDK